MRVLVTGGGGFLGGEVVRQLLARGDTVGSFSRGSYPWHRRLGVRGIRGDLADPDAVSAAVRGWDAVVHVAGLPGMWGPSERYRRANVDGTRNVVRACLAHGVGRLVHTSSPSVVIARGDIAAGDERLPLARRFLSPYPETKAAAERLVRAANGPDLATVVLRPHLIWGPGDTQLLPRIVARARSGRLRFVGDGQVRIDTTYVEDAARAHVLALDRVAVGAPCAGRAYFITSGQPLPVMEIVNRLLAVYGVDPVTTTVPYPVAYAVGFATEAAFRLLRRDDEPPLTRFLVQQLGTAHWFDISAARRDLGYQPRVSVEEGLRRLAAALQSEPAEADALQSDAVQSDAVQSDAQQADDVRRRRRS